MAIEDLVIEDLFGFFTSFSSIQTETRLKNIKSIIPYLSFIISSNDKAYNCLKSKMTNWDNLKLLNEYKKCPWVRCRFVSRMIDLEKEEKIVRILLYLYSEEVNDNEIYHILSAGWKRIALFVENKEIINIDEAPMRKRIEEKWVLCLLAYIKHRTILQAQDRKKWYEFSSELFFYFEFIVQRMDLDIQQNESFRKMSAGIEMIFYDEDEESADNSDQLIQTLFLIKEKERLIQNIICSSNTTTKMHTMDSNLFSIQKEVKIQANRKIDNENILKKAEHYEMRTKELEAQVEELSKENIKLKNALELLSEEVSLLKTFDDETIVLEDECDWEFLHQKRIVICGGRLEWINRIKQLFPQWKYIENDNIRFDGQLIKDPLVDAIVFNKRFVSHGLFYRVASQKLQSTPLIYVDSGNVEYSLQTIYNKLSVL